MIPGKERPACMSVQELSSYLTSIGMPMGRRAAHGAAGSVDDSRPPISFQEEPKGALANLNRCNGWPLPSYVQVPLYSAHKAVQVYTSVTRRRLNPASYGDVKASTKEAETAHVHVHVRRVYSCNVKSVQL